MKNPRSRSNVALGDDDRPIVRFAIRVGVGGAELTPFAETVGPMPPVRAGFLACVSVTIFRTCAAPRIGPAR